MTREEAVYCLKNTAWLGTYDVITAQYDVKKTERAIEMAIKALSDWKKGKWVWSDEDASWKCGCCDCVFEEIDWKPTYNYCPNCGAKMEGNDETD